MVEILTSLGRWLRTWGASSGGFQGKPSQEEILIHVGIPHASEWPRYAQIQINKSLVQVYEYAPFDQQTLGGQFQVINCKILRKTCNE